MPTTALPFLHTIGLDEAGGFEPVEQILELAPVEVGLQLSEQSGLLRVYPELRVHMPPRSRRPPALRLAAGEWVRWQLNYRSHTPGWSGEWLYSLDTFNVAFGAVAADTFLGAPSRLVEELGALR